MRRLPVLAALAAVLSACGSSAATQSSSSIMFGTTGGNILPFQVTIRPGGEVRGTGPAMLGKKQLSSATMRRLQRDVQLEGLSSRNCSGTLPDVASRFIRIGGHTVTVHGSCEPRFGLLWSELAQAVGLQSG